MIGKRWMILLLGLILVHGGLVSAETPNGAIFTVNSTDDTTDAFCNATHCSLREAINASNFNAGMDTIRFDFNSPTSFLPTSALPIITDPVEIDGITGTGSTCPTASNPADLHITLSGFSAGADVDGLVFDSGSDGSIVRGLNIILFDDSGIVLRSGADGISIECNHIGIPNADLNGFGNEDSGITDNGDNNFIGGTSAADRNVISGNGDAGILLRDLSDDVNIRRNYIGTTRDGSAPLENFWGILIHGENATIGWNGSGHNTISGNETHGIRFDGNGGSASSNTVLSNYIGVAADGVTPLSNGENGISLGNGASNNTIGTTNGHSIIAHNDHSGIRVAGDSTTGNAIRFNEIFDNGLLGIDLIATGDPDGTVTPNDVPDNDTGPNNLQNYPTLSSAENTGRIQGTFFGFNSSTYTIDIYQSDNCNASGHGEGQAHLDTFTLTAGAGADAIDRIISPPPTIGNYLTAVATDPNGDTSEFGNCVQVTEKIFVVNTLGSIDFNVGDGACDVDSGTAGEQCSLHAAITEVNNLVGGPYRVHFDFGSGTTTIDLTGIGLPAITNSIILDGSTNSNALCPNGLSRAVLKVVLDGSGLFAGTPILTLEAGSAGSEIRGFVIVNGSDDGILVNSNNNVIACNHIGVSEDGNNAQPNSGDGIEVTGDNNRIGAFNLDADRNVISGNSGAGVKLSNGADNNKVRGNYIGTVAFGTTPLGNFNGINLIGATTNTTIGGTTDTQRNLISGNNAYGVRIVDGSNSTSISGNYIGLEFDGRSESANALSGIYIDDSDDTTIGGLNSDETNRIGGNTRSGIVLINGTSNTDIINNFIGEDAGSSNFGNGYHGIHVDTFVTHTQITENIIANNGRDGIRVDPTSIHGEFLSNTIAFNGWLGIDLNENGVTPNDPNDTDSGANNSQNFADIIAADASTGLVTYELRSLSNSDFTVQIFNNNSCDLTGHGEGQELLHTFIVPTNGGGLATGSVTVTGLSGGEYLTTTATRHVAGGEPGETSEFSECFLVPVPTAVTVERSALSTQHSANWLIWLVLVLMIASGWATMRRNTTTRL